MRRYSLSFLALILPAMACGQSAPAEPWTEFFRGGEVVASVDSSRITRAGQGHEV